MKALVAACALAVVGCTFDESGPPSSLGNDGGGPRMADAAAQAPDSVPGAPDAPPPDARPACVDGDDDGFFTIGVPGADCGESLDCDDADPLAFPGQTQFFTQTRVSGGYDFDCNGNNERINTTQGGSCRTDWWDCLGAGWVGAVPACGDSGTWHECGGGGCNETSADVLFMSCR